MAKFTLTQVILLAASLIVLSLVIPGNSWFSSQPQQAR